MRKVIIVKGDYAGQEGWFHCHANNDGTLTGGIIELQNGRCEWMFYSNWHFKNRPQNNMETKLAHPPTPQGLNAQSSTSPVA